MNAALNGKTTPPHPTLSDHWLADVCRGLFSAAPAEIQAVGEGSNGCRSFKLRIGERQIKCFECESDERAQMVQRATMCLEEQRVPIPRIYGVVDHVVFAEWVRGRRLAGQTRATLVRRMAAYQAQMHSAEIPRESSLPARFIHLEWLLRRMQRVAGQDAKPERLLSLSEDIPKLTPTGLKVGIIQPDFIASNIVETASGELVIIDNEFLGINTGFEFDILNASHVMSSGDEDRRRRYIEAYEAAGDCGTLITHRKFWDICFLVKLVGKSFLIGDRQTGMECLESLEHMVENVQ